jgi:hypothetical protein
MALTLAEAAKSESNPLRAGVIEIFARSSPVMEFSTFQEISGNAYRYNLEGELPGIAFRGINEGYTESTGILNPQIESLAIAGGDSDTDKALMKSRPTNSIGELRAIYDGMKVKAFSGFITRNFFNGDSTSEPRAFDGMSRRCQGTQLISAGATSGGDTLTLAMLDELIDSVDVGDESDTIFFMNRVMRRKVNALMRAAGQTQEPITSQFGKQMNVYAGLPIGVIEADETGTEILRFNEAAPGGGSSVCTSIYLVRFAPDEYVSMLEANPGLEVADLGELQTKPAFRTRVEWMLSPAVFNKRGVARLRGVKNA